MHLKYGVEQVRDEVCSSFYTNVYHGIKVDKLQFASFRSIAGSRHTV